MNDYLREIAGTDFTAKDFRTWAGTVLAYRALRALAPADDEREAKRNVVEAIRRPRTASATRPRWRATRYVHPAVVDAYLDGRIGGALVEAAEEQDHPPSAADPDEEAEVVALLRAGSGRSVARRTKGGAGRAGAHPTRQVGHDEGDPLGIQRRHDCG